MDERMHRHGAISIEDLLHAHNVGDVTFFQRPPFLPAAPFNRCAVTEQQPHQWDVLGALGCFSAKWVIDVDTFNFTPMAHIFGE